MSDTELTADKASKKKPARQVVKFTDEEKFINVHLKKITSSLTARRMNQLITNYDGVNTWVLTNGHLPSPGDGPSDKKIRFDETYNLITFKNGYFDPIFQHFKELERRWTIDVRAFNKVLNGKHPVTAKMIASEEDNTLNASNDTQPSTEVGKMISSYHFANLSLVINHFKDIMSNGTEVHRVPITPHVGKPGKMYFVPVEFYKLYPDRDFLTIPVNVPMFQGYNTVSYSEYIKKYKVDEYTYELLVWRERYSMRTATVYEDPYVRVESIRPFIAYYPKRNTTKKDVDK